MYVADYTRLVWIVVKILVLLPSYLLTFSVVVGSSIIPEYFLTYSSSSYKCYMNDASLATCISYPTVLH